MNTDIFVITAFIKVLTRRLVEKGVFSDSEMIDIYADWFGEVVLLGAFLEESGNKWDLDYLLKVIEAMGQDFTPK